MFQDTFFGDPCSLAALLRRRSWLLEEITISLTMLPLGSSNLLTRVIDRNLNARVADKDGLRTQLATAPRYLTFHIVLAN